VSFLQPEPLPRRKKVMMGGMVALALLVAADALKLINLHGFGIPLLMSMSIFVALSQRWEREDREEHGHG
jgi:hypothetical protein